MNIHEFFPYLVHLGALLYLICFLFRNQIILRSFAIAGDLAYSGYFFAAAETPLWDAMFWSTLNIVINVVMISLILRDVRTTGFSENELLLFRSLKTVGPREFRKLSKLATWSTAEEETVLAREGVPQEHLHYILDGNVSASKSGRTFPLGTGLFIGEITFLKPQKATATITVMPGTRYVTWRHGALATALDKDNSLRDSFMSLLASDMAGKLAKS